MCSGIHEQSKFIHEQSNVQKKLETQILTTTVEIEICWVGQTWSK